MTASATDYTKTPVRFVDLDLDYCSLTHSQGTCQANRSSSGGQCYNTFETCQDPSNFTLTTKRYRYSMASGPIVKNVDSYRRIESIAFSPGYIRVDRGLAANDRITVTLRDFTDDDVDVDPYVDQRLAPPGSRHFRRLRQRNPYFRGRAVYVRSGYLEPDGTIDVDSMTTQRYIFQEFNFGTDGKVTLVFADILKQLSNVKIPAATAAELDGDLTDSATSFNLTGRYDELPESNFYLAIDDETVLVGTRTGAACTSVTRALAGSTAAEHSDETRVQLTKRYNGTPAAVWKEIQTDAGIEESLIDYSGAVTEQAYILSGVTNTAFIREPTPADQLMIDQLHSNAAYTWWDRENQVTKFGTIRPTDPANETTTTLTWEANFVGDENELKFDEKRRLTRVIMYFGVYDWSQSLKKYDRDRPNFKRAQAYIDAVSENSLKYGDVADREVFAYFLPSSLANEAASIAYYYLSRHLKPIRVLSFELEAKDADSLHENSVISALCPEIIDDEGQPVALEMFIIQKTPPQGDGIVTKFVAEAKAIEGKPWIWAPDSDQAAYHAQYSDDDGLLADGVTEGFRWV